MINYRKLVNAYRSLELGSHSRIIVHVSTKFVSETTGGADTIIGSMLSEFRTFITPTFTKKPSILPSIGPADNGIDYKDQFDFNTTAEFFHSELPSDRELGSFAESMRRYPNSRRSPHPLFSFSGLGEDEALLSQSIEDLYAPIHWLADFDGDVLLIDTDHRRNFSIHYGEKLSGRRQFTRWALTEHGILQCPDCPGCSDGFNVIQDRMSGVSRRVVVDGFQLQSIPLRDLINIVQGWVREDPRALLCDTTGCSHCSIVRSAVRVST
jgi:aminoglycoside 3-N-acetyltransferase